MKNNKSNMHKGYRYLDFYGVSDYVATALCIGLVVLVPLDWMFPPDAADEGVRGIPVAVRAVLLAIMLLYILATTGVEPWVYGLKFARMVMPLGVLIVMYAIFGPAPDGRRGNLYTLSKYIFWIAGVIAFYRMAWFNFLRFRQIIIVTRLVVIIGSIYTIHYCLFVATRKWINADAYLLLFCIPMLLVEWRSVKSLILVGLASIAILLTVKRGACVAWLFSGAAYLITFIKINRKTLHVRSEKIFILVVLIIVVVVSLGIWRWDKILERTTDLGGGIGELGSFRGTLYTLIIERWYKADLVNQIFGFGFHSVARYTGVYMFQDLYAHSDWLEVLHDYGVVGVVMLGLLHIEFLIIVRKALRENSPIAPSLVMGYSIFLLSSLYSGMLMFPRTIYFSIFWGYACAVIMKNEEPQRYVSSHRFYTG